MTVTSTRANAGRLIGRALFMCALWLVLTSWEGRSPWVAVLVIGAATAVSAALRRPAPRVRLGVGAALAFVPFFLWSSLRGGVDVASRAFRPSRPLAPELLRLPLRVAPDHPAATLLVLVVSLLPGTLSAELDDEAIVLHVVDREHANESKVRELELRLARALGAEIRHDGGAA